jgi:hypothetical protein
MGQFEYYLGLEYNKNGFGGLFGHCTIKALAVNKKI